jgi:4-amino-4-deoxy-L-arabinose transferase-like glycosyltransferase
MNRARWLNVSLLSAWLLFTIFALSGVPTVPFHPDESTYLYMSHDFDLLLRQGNPAAVSWLAPNTPEAVQRYRLLDSPLTYYLPGLGRLLGGYSEHLPNDWDWSGNWAANIALGALPGPGLLTAARWPAAVFTVLSVLPLYGIGFRLGGRLTGLGAALLYAFSGLVLLHGRRAMSEGPLLFFILLTLWLVLVAPRRPALWGAAAALAVAAKLTALSLLPVLALALCWPRPGANGWRAWLNRQQVTRAGLCAATFVVLSAVLSPFLWSQPLAGLAAMIDARRQLLTNQTGALAAAGSIQVAATLPQRLFAMLYHVFFAPPAFSDISNYAPQTAAAEQRYLSLPLQTGWHSTSLSFNLAAGGLLLALALAGIFFAVRARLTQRFPTQPAFGQMEPRVAGLLLLWSLFSVVGLLVINIAWQRYYLPLIPVACLWAAYGAVQVVRPFTAALAARWARGT